MYENSIIIPEIMPWIMLLVASSGIFVWRFLGVVLSSKIQKDSFFAKWINAIAFAMTTALMTRIIIFPTGALAETELIERIVPFLIGIIIFLVSLYIQREVITMVLNLLHQRNIIGLID